MNEKKVNRRNFLKTAGTAAAAIPILNKDILSNQESKKKIKINKSVKPRNVIVILSDDHRYDFMSFMGKPKFLETPNMDRMAKDGAHIKNAFVTTSLCSPSRASILTGMFSHKHTVVDNDAPVPENITFFPQYLQEAGYKTCMIGKWHMGHEEDEPRKGFDRWVSFKGQGVYFDPELNIDGEKLQEKGHISDVLTKYAVDWIDEQNENPFFMYLSHKAVHADFQPAPRHAGKYKNTKIEYPESMANTENNYNGKPKWVKEQRYSWHGVDYLYHGEMNFDDFYRRYCETLLGIDESIGNVFEALDKKGMLDSTLVVYLGDNGFCLGEHGLIDKRQMYEESMRIPMMVHCPELVKGGTVLSELVQNIDIAPTVLELAGIEKPNDMDGESMISLLQGKETKWRNEVFYEYYWERPFPHTPTVFGVRTKKYKYMTYHGAWDIDELYDIENDPNEMSNLIDDENHLDIVLELRKKVYDWLEETQGMKIPLKRSGLWQANKHKLEVEGKS